LQSKENLAQLNVRSTSFTGEPAWGNGMYLKHLNHVAGNLAGSITFGTGMSYGIVLVRN